MTLQSEILHLRSAVNDCWALIVDLCRENDRLEAASWPPAESEGTMDSFVEYVTKYWGRLPVDQIAISMKLRITTIQGWQDFITRLISARLAAGNPIPTAEQIVDEWHKDHPPAHVISTPFGDTTQPVGGGTVNDFVSELKALIVRYNL